MNFKVSASALIIAALFVSCKKDSKSSSASGPLGEGPKDGEVEGGDNGKNEDPITPGTLALGTVNLAISAVNGLDVTNSQVEIASGTKVAGSLAITTASLTSFSLSDVGQTIPSPATTVKGELNGITSGPPDGFKIKVTKISLRANDVPTKVFEKAEGAEIVINGAIVDLSAVIAALGGTGDDAALKVAPGTYDEVEVTYKKKAEIKGCVSGFFDEKTNKKINGGANDGDLIPEYTGDHTYCTQAAKSLYNVTDTTTHATFPKNVDFESTTGSVKEAEWMSIELGRYPSWSFQPQDDGPDPSPHSTNVNDDFQQSYKLPEPLVITAGASIDLTMVIDMNRLLRYETGATANKWGTNKNQPSSDYPTVYSPAFFFDSAFTGSTFVFAGKPGGIYGYEILSFVCKDVDYNSTSKQCANDGYFAVETWMTLITDNKGAPLSMLIQPKDDTRLTTLVGNHVRGGNWIFPASNGETADIRYTMGDAFKGTLYGFPAALDETEPVAADAAENPDGGQFTLEWDLHDLDDQYGGQPVYPSSVTNGPYQGDKKGLAVFWRRL